MLEATHATIVTQGGKVVVEVFAADAPLAVLKLCLSRAAVIAPGSRFIVRSRTSWRRTAAHAVMDVAGRGTRFAMS